MSGETEAHVSGWTVDTLKEHLATLRRADEQLRAADQRFFDERDRRYAEVDLEREKALKIKETADETARILAREIQDYKDEKANNLREQISGERGIYATKDELIGVGEKIAIELKPLADFVSSQQGRSEGIGFSGRVLVTVLTVLVMTLGLALSIAIATKP